MPPGEVLAAELGERALFRHTDITSTPRSRRSWTRCRALRPPRRSRQPRVHVPRRRLFVLPGGLARRARRQRRQRRRDGADRPSASEGERSRCDRQLRVHLRQGRTDGPLALPGQQGRARAADPQHGDGPRPDGIRVNAVSPGWTWSKVMVELTGDDRAKTDRVAAPFHLLGRVGDPEEVARSSPSSSPTTRASSPAPPGRSTAATPRWGRRAPSRRFPS